MGKNVLVAGRSKNVGMPIAMLLHTDRNHERPGGKCVCVCVFQMSQNCNIIAVLLILANYIAPSWLSLKDI